MDAARRQVLRADTLEPYVRGRGSSGLPRHLGPQAFVHLWLVLMIVGSLGVLAASMPLPAYWSTIASVDPTLVGWMAH